MSATSPDSNHAAAYRYTVDEILDALATDGERGLGQGEARARLARYGPNELTAEKRIPGWRKFLAQFRDVLVILLLVATAAPPILARRESGRDLFRLAEGRQVLAWGAWRTAWMAGYFYNDGKVRQVASAQEIVGAATSGPVLALCGPAERRTLEASPSLQVTLLSEGPRANVLLRVEQR